MYWCSNCKKLVWGKDVTIVEPHPEVRNIAGDVPCEEWDTTICEECRESFLEKPGKCVLCGDDCKPGDEYCDWCIGEIKATVDSALDNIQERYPEIHENVLFYALYDEMERRERA